MNLKNLPEIQFMETDADTIEQRVIAKHEEITGRTLYPGDPERLFLESLIYENIVLRQAFNSAAKMNLLAYATGNFLDHLGAFTDTDRLNAQAATTTVRFQIDAALGFDVVIPKNTRVTPDNTLMFATKELATITAGNTYVDVIAECQTAGEIGNDFVAGQINLLVDPIAYVTGAANTDKSSGGADKEEDDAYRNRIQLSPEKFSVAGPTGAYIYYARSAHQDIIDVAVWSSTPGQVDVRPLMKDGELPDAAMIQAVEDALAPEDVRPLDDTVVVAAPTQVQYNITLTYYIHADDSALVSQIQTAVNTAVDNYVAWQKEKLGRDITPTYLISLIQNAGAKRVDVTAPVYTDLDKWEVAADNTISVTYGGLESE
jgi:phage-related baseplate assembly protein